jgi:MFS family permease
MTEAGRVEERDGGPSRSRAFRFVLLIGLVSLLADVTYEGARSVIGPWLALLGAGAAAVSITAGLGELIGYALRLAFGYLADRTGRVWSFVLAGYAVNLLAVPMLALAGRWEVAAALILLERLGKAVRTPARDAMLSHATTQTGRGWGFGLHEALDQLGAMLGPLLVAAVYAWRGEYRTGFAVLLIPALLALAVLLLARASYPRPHDLEVRSGPLEAEGLPFVFWLYLGTVALVAAGYADFPLIAFHFLNTGSVPEVWIPILYSVAMGVDAVAALVLGRLFDRVGIGVVASATLLAAAFAPLVFLGGFTGALAGMTLWGIGMGSQESIVRAAVAGMVPAGRRGTAYGIFGAGWGFAWFAGSAVLGILYDVSLPALVAFSVACQLLSVPLLLRVARLDAIDMPAITPAMQASTVPEE